MHRQLCLVGFEISSAYPITIILLDQLGIQASNLGIDDGEIPYPISLILWVFVWELVSVKKESCWPFLDGTCVMPRDYTLVKMLLTSLCQCDHGLPWFSGGLIGVGRCQCVCGSSRWSFRSRVGAPKRSYGAAATSAVYQWLSKSSSFDHFDGWTPKGHSV